MSHASHKVFNIRKKLNKFKTCHSWWIALFINRSVYESKLILQTNNNTLMFTVFDKLFFKHLKKLEMFSSYNYLTRKFSLSQTFIPIQIIINPPPSSLGSLNTIPICPLHTLPTPSSFNSPFAYPQYCD